MDNCRVIWVWTPETKSQGAKATIVVKTAKITGRDTLAAPTTAACSPSSPLL